MTLAISLALVAGLLWAISNIIDKIALTKYVRNPFAVMPAVSMMSLIVGTVIVTINYQPYPEGIFWRLAFFAALNFLSIVFYFFALKDEEVSRMVPLYGTTPVFMVLIELIAFGTKLSIWQYWGVAAVVIGAIVLSWKTSGLKFNKKGLFLILGSSITWAVAVVFLTDILDTYGYWLGWGWVELVIGVLGMISLIFIRQEFIRVVKSSGRKILYLIMSSQLFSISAKAILFFAAVSWVASLSSAVASDQFILLFLFSLLISWKYPQILKEEINPRIIIQKTISILLIIAGIFLISL